MNVQKLQIENTSTEVTRFNALRHGILSRYTVLPWKDENEYLTLARKIHEKVPPSPHNML